MKKRTRFYILVLSAILFLIVAPYIVAYSLGYRIDFEQMKIVSTGGIYVKAQPLGAEIIIDSESNRTGLLSQNVFVQNLLPKQHTVIIKKDGYHDYKKSLEVKEREVVRLEKVILFKENIAFEPLTDKTNSPFLEKEEEKLFVIKGSNLYRNQPGQSQPILRKVLVFETQDGNIIWISQNGILNKSSGNGENTEKLTQTPLKISKNKTYKIIAISRHIFLLEDSNLLKFNEDKKDFEPFYDRVKDIKLSPDGQKVLYYNDSEILYSYLNSTDNQSVFLNRFSEKIGEVFWLNNDYIVFTLLDKVVISEIDVRDGINMITLPEAITLTDNNSIALKDIKIYLEKEQARLYIQSQDNIILSERLIP